MTERRHLAALYAAAAALPHLSGLAHLVTLSEDLRIATAGVTASGRLLINPQWFGALAFSERVFVMAHELMHLALRSHERCAGSEARLFNVAHDLIINDMLAKALNMPVPANGLFRPGAAGSSAERIVTSLKRQEAGGEDGLRPVWQNRPRALGALGAALVAAGLSEVQPGQLDADVLDAATERRLFPGQPPDPSAMARIAAAGERAVALDVWIAKTKAVFGAFDAATAGGSEVAQGLWEVLETYHAPPWEVALQHWLDDAAPAGRSYRRCSRRQGDRADVVLAGRNRDGWTLTLILDTSGSMFWTDGGDSPIARALAALKSFCIGANVGRVRIVQGGMEIEADDIVDPRDLDRFAITGGGGSDMAPSMRMLAADPEVEAVIVVTDGDIAYPEEPMPYQVLWVLTGETISDDFAPPYGRIILLNSDHGA